MIPARWKTVAPLAPAQRRPDGGGVAHVALHDLDVRVAAAAPPPRACPAAPGSASRSKRGCCAVGGVVGVGLVQEVHEPVAEPAGEAGDESCEWEVLTARGPYTRGFGFTVRFRQLELGWLSIRDRETPVRLADFAPGRGLDGSNPAALGGHVRMHLAEVGAAASLGTPNPDQPVTGEDRAGTRPGAPRCRPPQPVTMRAWSGPLVILIDRVPRKTLPAVTRSMDGPGCEAGAPDLHQQSSPWRPAVARCVCPAVTARS